MVSSCFTILCPLPDIHAALFSKTRKSFHTSNPWTTRNNQPLNLLAASLNAPTFSFLPFSASKYFALLNNCYHHKVNAAAKMFRKHTLHLLCFHLPPACELSGLTIINYAELQIAISQHPHLCLFYLNNLQPTFW